MEGIAGAHLVEIVYIDRYQLICITPSMEKNVLKTVHVAEG